MPLVPSLWSPVPGQPFGRETGRLGNRDDPRHNLRLVHIGIDWHVFRHSVRGVPPESATARRQVEP